MSPFSAWPTSSLFSLQALAVLATAVLGGCSGSHGRSVQGGGGRDWLDTCSTDSECGALDCVCGECNITCSNDRACVMMDTRARCSVMAPAQREGEPFCAKSAQQSCILPCSDDIECEGGLVCDATACVVPKRIDAGDDPGFVSESGTAALGSSSRSGSDFMQISAGSYHTCGLHEDGSISCWGDTSRGRVDVPDAARRPVFVQVAAGPAHTCALDREGSAICWGSDDYGQSSGPSEQADNDSTGFARLAVGANKTCGLRDDGSAVCWGADFLDSVHGPTDDDRMEFVQITVGYAHTCAILSDGTASCWGSDDFGQVSGPIGEDDGGSTLTQIAAGTYQTCALRDDGSIVCWGDTFAGEDPTTPDNRGPGFVQLVAGTDHACALRRDGSLFCWGGPGIGPAVTGPNGDGAADFVQVTVSSDPDSHHTCGLRSDGSVSCWGSNFAGQLDPP